MPAQPCGLESDAVPRREVQRQCQARDRISLGTVKQAALEIADGAPADARARPARAASDRPSRGIALVDPQRPRTVSSCARPLLARHLSRHGLRPCLRSAMRHAIVPRPAAVLPPAASVHYSVHSYMLPALPRRAESWRIRRSAEGGQATGSAGAAGHPRKAVDYGGRATRALPCRDRLVGGGCLRALDARGDATGRLPRSDRAGTAPQPRASQPSRRHPGAAQHAPRAHDRRA